MKRKVKYLVVGFLIGFLSGLIFSKKVIFSDFKWITNLSVALITPTVAACGVWIAYAQREINRRRLQHELFDRRIKVYNFVATYIANILSLGDVENGKEFQFLRDTKHSIFIFDKEIADYIDEVYEKSINYQALAKQEKSPGDKSLKTVSSEKNKIFTWFSRELGILPEKFEKFLKI